MNPLSSLKVGARLGVGFGMLLLLMTALAAIGLSRLSLLQRNLDHLVQRDFAQVAHVNAMRDAVRQQSEALRDIILQQDVSFIKTELKFMKEARARYRSSAAALDKLVAGSRDKGQLVQLAQLEDRVQGMVDQAVDFSLSGDPANAAKVMREQIRPGQLELLSQLDGMLKRRQRVVEVLAQGAAQAYHGALIFMIALWAAAMALGAGIAYFITRSITQPLNRAVGVARKIARGDLSGSIEVRGGDELATLLLALKDMNQHLLQIIGGVSRASNDVASSSSGLSAEAAQVSARVESQTERIMQISAAIEEVTVSIAEVASGASRVAEASAKTQDIAASGNENMTREVQSSQRIVTSVESSGATIEELSGAIERIGEVTRVIKEIADQTNLLALNAAIEAARAGEQGRGFAVVADEVRKLAERTSSSTTDIAQVVEVIHSKTGMAVTAMRQVRQEVREESELTLKTRDILREIAAAATEVNKLAQDIAAATNEQKAASTETAVGMEKISGLTEENAASIRHVGAAADSLAATAGELQRLVGQFKLAG